MKLQKIHREILQIGVVNWGFTVNEVGEPVLIEGSMENDSIWLIEMEIGCGAFGKRTVEDLERLRFVEVLQGDNAVNMCMGK